MIPRQNPRQIPDKPHYLAVEVEGLGVTNWRIPSMVKASQILSMLQSTGVLEAAEGAADGNDLVANLGDRLPSLLACQGAMIGLCWYDVGQDLETAASAFSDLSAYGVEVYEELHEEGWQIGQVQAVWIKLTERITASFISQKEVAEKVDFLSVSEGAAI